jgi:anti-sigma-K factor RskA
MRLVNLTGQQPAPLARARALYDPATRECFLLVADLPRAPQGKAYEVWVIAGAAGAAPMPAGTFQTDDEGAALVRLPMLDATARVKTFAVSLEPEWGVPAPTGPIVLAGSAP